jgi:hypothetical protein
MKIKFTYVDSVTQISVEKEPAKHGPHFPKIKGLNYLFALERKYPTMFLSLLVSAMMTQT